MTRVVVAAGCARGSGMIAPADGMRYTPSARHRRPGGFVSKVCNNGVCEEEDRVRARTRA